MNTITLGAFVAARGTSLKLRPGQVLFRQGDQSAAVYSCVNGRVNLTITTPTGREVLLGFKTPGQAFGELSAIDGGRRSATATATEPSVVAQLSADAFIDALADAPALGIVVLRELSEHLRRLNARLTAGSSERTVERVGNLLIDLAALHRRHGVEADTSPRPATATVVLSITQDEVAAWIGSTREAATRSLAVLRGAGAIQTGRNKITVLDDRRLAAAMTKGVLRSLRPTDRRCQAHRLPTTDVHICR